MNDNFTGIRLVDDEGKVVFQSIIFGLHMPPIVGIAAVEYWEEGVKVGAKPPPEPVWVL